MRKRIFSVLLVAVLVASTLLGCVSTPSTSSNTGSAQEEIVLTFLDKHPEEGYVEYFEKSIKEFEAAHQGVTIKYENISDTAIKEKLAVLAAGGDLPDIFFSWGGESLNRFARSGRLLDLTPYMDKDNAWRESFLPSFLSSSVLNGKNYAVPYRSSILYMLYNDKIFKENNLKVPENWDEFIIACEALKNNGITPIAFGNSGQWYSMWYVGQFNANYVDAATRLTDYTPTSGEFSDQGYLKAVQTFLDLHKNGYFGENVNSKDYYQVREEFSVGKYGMMLDATSQFSFYSEAMGTEGGYGYFKIPIPTDANGDEATSIVTGGSENYAISAECKHPDLAVEFLKFMTSKEKALQQTKETGLPNALIGGITAENTDPMIAAAYKTAENYTAIAEWLDQVIDGNISNAYMAGLQLGLEGKSAEEIIADVQLAAKETANATK